ncbi:MAG: hypothetical protein ACC619_11245 [Paracoccaceae bacterium]
MKIIKTLSLAAAGTFAALPALAQSHAAPQMDAQELILSTQGMDASTTVMLLIIALFIAVLTAGSSPSLDV